MDDKKPAAAGQHVRHRRSWVWLKLLVAIVLGYLIHWSWPLMKEHLPFRLEMGAEEVLAILAIAFAVVQFLDARTQERELGTISEDLEQETTKLRTEIGGITRRANELQNQLQSVISNLTDISGSMSTRFVGPFPENMKEIISLLKRASRTIDIVVDFAGYGQLSALRDHMSYIQAVQGARQEHVRVRIIGYQLPLARKEWEEQFPDGTPESWAAMEQNSNFREYFSLFSSIRRPRDCAGLREILISRDRSLVRELQERGIDWKFHEERAAFFLWLVDESEAIFTFKNVGRKDIGLSFRTHDGNLMTQFKEIFKRRWLNAQEDYDPGTAAPKQN